MNLDDSIKLFALNNLSIESEIRRIEIQEDIDLGHRSKKLKQQEQKYYPQFSQRLRNEAEEMSRHYSVFYCLENSIREIVNHRL